MDKEFNVKIAECSKELSTKERIAIKDTGDALKLDQLTADGGEVVISVDYFAKLAVHNEKSENKDYEVCVIVDKDGQKYCTGSPSFIRALDNIYDEVTDADDMDDFSIKVYRRESKNYKGKTFISCSIA